MINFFCFLLLLDSKVDFKDYCKSCHGDAKSFYSGVIKTKDLPNNINVMMKNYGQEIYSKKRVAEMLKYAKSFKGAKK